MSHVVYCYDIIDWMSPLSSVRTSNEPRGSAFCGHTKRPTTVRE